MKKIVLLPRIRVHNANALSSPYTIGFPAMTAWLGAVHALQRHLNQDGLPDVRFISVAVVSHSFDLQTYKGPGDYIHSIVGTGNPLDKKGERPAFIEEARCHLTVSLVIEYQNLATDNHEDAADKITESLNARMKIAGGDILEFRQPAFFTVDSDIDLGKLRRQLMPGYALIERRDLMENAMKEGQDALEALLEHLKIMHRCEIDENENITWSSNRKESGWVVPIATGFQGITEPGHAENQRDPEMPHRFAESIVTLGEFIMPYRVKNLDEILWHYHVDSENNLYLCQQNNRMN